MSSHFKWALTHFVFGVLLIVMGIVDLGLYNYTFWSIGSGGFFVIFCGVWMCIIGGILARNREGTSCWRNGLAGVFITSCLCGIVGCGYHIFLIVLWSFFPNGPRLAVAAIVLTLAIVQCITGYNGCGWVLVSSSSQHDQTFSPFTVPAGDAQMVPTCMPPRSVFQANGRSPPYGAGSQGPGLLLVPLEITPISLQSVFQDNGRPSPYTFDAQTCSQGSDRLLALLEMTPMPPQETGSPPTYHQISTTGSAMSNFHDGDQPPPQMNNIV